MSEFTRILAATDLSAPSRHAVTRALFVAGVNGTNVSLVHVINQGALDNLRKFVGGKSPAVEQRIFDEAREAMTQMVADHGRVHGGAVSIRLLEGSVSRTLMDEADAMGADLVVLGARGEHYMRTLMLGTMSERLLNSSRHPMLVVKQRPREVYRRVLIPVDLSSGSAHALRMARAIAPQAGLILLHAFEAPFESKLRYAGVEEDVIQAYRAETMRESMARLVEISEQAGLRPGDVSFSVKYGDPARVILACEQNEDCDLIVMGKHGRGIIEDLLLGSVTRHVLSLSESDVLVAGG
ncbi:MAG: universal stress protein [Gammaproteobacteria bacterium]|nr:universal stress protein [Gammaproteobacteria bacterium]